MLFILLAKLTDDGLQACLDNPDAFADACNAVDVPETQILARYATLGQYDFVVLVEADGAQRMSRLSVGDGRATDSRAPGGSSQRRSDTGRGLVRSRSVCLRPDRAVLLVVWLRGAEGVFLRTAKPIATITTSKETGHGRLQEIATGNLEATSLPLQHLQLARCHRSLEVSQQRGYICANGGLNHQKLFIGTVFVAFGRDMGQGQEPRPFAVVAVIELSL